MKLSPLPASTLNRSLGRAQAPQATRLHTAAPLTTQIHPRSLGSPPPPTAPGPRASRPTSQTRHIIQKPRSCHNLCGDTRHPLARTSLPRAERRAKRLPPVQGPGASPEHGTRRQRCLHSDVTSLMPESTSSTAPTRLRPSKAPSPEGRLRASQGPLAFISSTNPTHAHYLPPPCRAPDHRASPRAAGPPQAHPSGRVSGAATTRLQGCSICLHYT